MRTSRFVTSLVVLVALAYAVVRYVVIGTVAPAQLPVFIVNKGLGVAALVLVAIAVAIGPLVRMRAVQATWMAERKQLGVTGFVLGALHSVLAIATLSPASYAKLYDAAGKLTLEGGLVVLGGVLAFGALVVPATTSAALVRKSMPTASWRRAQRLAIVALAIAVAHVAVLGWRSWLAPSTWIGGLPPLTLIAVAAGVLAFAVRGAELLRAARRDQRVPQMAAFQASTSRRLVARLNRGRA